MTGPHVVVNPAVRAGQPQIKGVPLFAPVGDVWRGDHVDAVAADYDLTRADVLVACWYAGTYGLPSEKGGPLAATPTWSTRWARWAESVTQPLAVQTAAELIPDPPDRHG